jgi:hypothetical protein
MFMNAFGHTPIDKVLSEFCPQLLLIEEPL